MSEPKQVVKTIGKELIKNYFFALNMSEVCSNTSEFRALAGMFCPLTTHQLY